MEGFFLELADFAKSENTFAVIIIELVHMQFF